LHKQACHGDFKFATLKWFTPTGARTPGLVLSSVTTEV
jgi:hypothetical protein